jgi:hypothetical protein
VLTTIGVFGVRLEPARGVLALHGPGALRRASAAALAAVDPQVDALWRAWSRERTNVHTIPTRLPVASA